MVSSLSIIIPVLNEEAGIAAALERLAGLRRQGVEIIVADGGSDDGTVSCALPWCDSVIQAPRGRASQMNAGASAAQGAILLFLHADTVLPRHSVADLCGVLNNERHVWGRFDVTISGRSPLLPVVAAMMNLRSRWSGIATGDQAMFVRRDVFDAIGGFPDIPLMEDIALSKRLKQRRRPLCLREKVTTSGRRWEKHGVLRTILMMWRLRLQYWLSADPAALARQYGYKPREDK